MFGPCCYLERNVQGGKTKMASNVRDSDTSLWLHNKLGTSTDSWAGGSICSQLNPEVLKNIQECFVELQTQVKLKFLLSFFQFSRKNLEEVRFDCFEFNLTVWKLKFIFSFSGE